MVGVTSGSYEANGMWVVKVNNRGDVIWNKTFSDMIGWQIISSRYGGYVIIAEKYVNTSKSDSSVCLIKIDNNGYVEWNSTYNFEGNDRPCSIIQLPDGGFLIVGSTRYLTETSDVFLIKTDANGGVIWKKTYGGDKLDRAYDAIRAVDDGYMIVGETSSYGASDIDILLMKINEDGTLEWVKTYSSNKADYVASLAISVAPSIIINNHVISVTMDNTLFLVRLRIIYTYKNYH